jgi:hypothetical protein
MDIIIPIILIAFIAYRELAFSRERKDFLDRLTKREQDFLDRLMAKDLPEVKREQTQPREPVAITRRQNDIRLAEMAKKAES